MERVSLEIEGMTCGHCVAQVSTALQGIDGVEVEQVGIGNATVRFDERATSERAIAQAIEDEGYTVASATR